MTSEHKLKKGIEGAVSELNKQGADLSYPTDETGHIKAFTPTEFVDWFGKMQEAYDKGDLTFKNETKEEIDERKRKWNEEHKNKKRSK